MKPQLTTAERHEIYKEALEIMQSSRGLGLCMCIYTAIHRLAFDRYTYDPFNNMELYFAEVYAHKPKQCHDDAFWFNKNDRAPRIAILTDCIAQTAPNQHVPS